MKERPILFSGPMVRAILEGRKTQTRRFLHESRGNFWGHAAYEPRAHEDGTWGWYVKDTGEGAHLAADFRCPYGVPGDRLWVRETFRQAPGSMSVHYAADPDEVSGGPWRPSIFMARWASRLTLEITDVRVQRLQEISEEDAIVEGVEPYVHPFRSDSPRDRTARDNFEILWDSINAKRAPWASNPWVWAITFKVSK